ncbi:MAG: hypothetical protein ACYC96_14405 [Fimbriimonadaceae bacterium]
MSSSRDHDLLGFALGELGALKRLDVRVRLAFSASARRRLAELEQVTGAVAGAVGVGGVAGFTANRRVKLRRLMFVDLVLAALMLSAVAIGATVVWRVENPPPRRAAPCPDGSPSLTKPPGQANKLKPAQAAL